MKKPKPDRKKLPQWAQDELRRLEQSITYWRQKAHEACGEDPSNTSLLTHEDADKGKNYLPNNSIVRFDLCGSRHQDLVYVDVVVRDGALYLNANDRIGVAPVASNVVTISPLESE